jgi:hypothetical protein
VQTRRLTSAILALASVSIMAACGDDDDDPMGIGNDDATVRFFNATSGGLNLDIAENGTVDTGNSNIAFNNSSSCIRVNSTNPQLAVRTANSTTSLPGFAPAFAANGSYTVLVTGTQAAPVFTTLSDQVTAPTTGVAVRIINATSSATAWDIYVNPGTTVVTPSATAVGRNTASPFLTLPAGQVNTLHLTNTGQTTVLTGGTITVPSAAAGTVRTIVVTDASAGSPALGTKMLEPCT